MFHYRYIYKTVFGTKWQDLDAEDNEAADRIFWEDKLSDLNEIVMVEKSSLPVDAKAPPEDRDISGFVCSAYARPTAGSEQLTWTRCSKTRSNSLTTSKNRRA